MSTTCVFFALNPAAFVFGGLFILQGGLFLFSGIMKREISFGYRRDLSGYAGGLLLAYGLIVYPVVGYFMGHVYPYSPTFGAPCPTTIFTFGLLLWTTTHVWWYLLIIPGLWSLMGFTAAMNLGIREDIGLLISGIVCTALLTVRKNRGARSVPAAAASDSDGKPGGR